MTIIIHEDSVVVEVKPGGMLNAPPPPDIPGYECHFVAHHGAKRTVYTYRKRKPTPLPVAGPPPIRVIRPDIMGGQS